MDHWHGERVRQTLDDARRVERSAAVRGDEQWTLRGAEQLRRARERLGIRGCAGAPRQPSLEPIAWPDDSPALQLQVLNRVSWGASRSSAAEIARLGTGGWLAAQLQPSPATLTADIQARVDEMTNSRR